MKKGNNEMSILKHTPGPWVWGIPDYSTAILHVEGDLENEICEVSPCRSCIERIKEKYINPQWVWGRCITPKEADAKLIATAPELLDAIINYIKRNNSGTEKDLISYNIFVSVIEKATGLTLKEIIDL
jgi:hypothetical protein